MDELRDFIAEDGKKQKPTQLQRYIEADAPDEIMYFMNKQNGKGLACERLAREKFPSLDVRAGDSGHDHLLGNLKVEHKTSGLWNGVEFKWQHIEPNHDWDFLILTAIGFHDIRWFFMSKSDFLNLKVEEEITQGKKGVSFEGYWFTMTQGERYLTEFYDNDGLIKLANGIS